MYFAKWPILLIAALVGFFRGLFWLCDRYPKTMFLIIAFLQGLTEIIQMKMIALIALATLLALIAWPMVAEPAEAGSTSCTTRKSGSTTITSCSNNYRGGGLSQCRSYMSGSVRKTSCRY